VELERVETEEEMSAALEQSQWDVVIADYSLPRFSGPDALALLTRRRFDIPFILVSGVLTEEKAVSIAGGRASDYLVKTNLARLAPAIERVLHESELKRQTTATKNALESEISAREEERRRIAGELHDEAGQILASLLAHARTIEDASSLEVAKARASELRSLTSEAMDSITRLALGLHPIVLNDLGLGPALQYYLDEYEAIQGIEVNADITCIETIFLSPKARLGIYRIVQEALTNVAKHAAATKVSVSAQIHAKTLTLKIADNGQGFDDQRANTEKTQIGYGLRSMYDRAAIIGGHLDVQSSLRSDTSVVLTLPLDTEMRDAQEN
jgi:signal transduction histidine kinase